MFRAYLFYFTRYTFRAQNFRIQSGWNRYNLREDSLRTYRYTCHTQSCFDIFAVYADLPSLRIAKSLFVSEAFLNQKKRERTCTKVVETVESLIVSFPNSSASFLSHP